MPIVALLALARPGAVRAQARERPSVSVSIADSCAELDADVVRHVLEVELGGDAELASPDEASSRVAVRCEGTRALIEIDERLTHKELRRALELGASREASTRMVGLAIAELLAASWLELGTRHEAVAETVGEPARESALRIVRERWTLTMPQPDAPSATRAGPLAIRALASARLSGGEPQHVAFGGGLALSLELLAPLALAIDLRADHARDHVYDVGAVAITSATLGAILAVRLSLGDENLLELGGGARGGAGWLEGRADASATSATIVGPIFTLLGAASLATRITRAAYVHVGVELGWVVAGIYGTLAPVGETIARIGGTHVAITLGFEVRPEP
ncbi:hypothetical protein [Sandaracinus amylolyticus]|uniref:hypothetical protein n=1 Tax=Sandaracinus amylolyticus TaxID=927083 RepID=UPI001F21AAF4|nr:hypothetical protein [Sandaracinus amylolyticus]UJR83086.1 Hypothetical protein I5071_51520 [Sandaracinus amylolyticus]